MRKEKSQTVSSSTGRKKKRIIYFVNIIIPEMKQVLKASGDIL